MSDPPVGEVAFREQCTGFAEQITRLLNAVFGGDVEVTVTDADHRSRIVADVPLTVRGENLARLKIDVWCCLDSRQRFLAVEESTYQLIVLPIGPTGRNRNASWWVDLGRAYLLHGDRARCLDALRRARSGSPQWVRYHPAVHETLATLARTDARRAAGLSDLAIWAGVAH